MRRRVRIGCFLRGVYDWHENIIDEESKRERTYLKLSKCSRV